MSLASDYARQYRWRPWPELFAALPPVAGQTVLDLGCGIGDQAAELCARGARVIGIDANEELLAQARRRDLTRAEFRAGDLRALPELELKVDGIWSSFSAAYFTDLSSTLAQWAAHLRPGGWIALTEIDDLFGHEPVASRTRSLLEAYAHDALRERRYDFHMGRKLRAHLERAGFVVTHERQLADQELAFTGPAHADVVDAWRARFERMQLLHAFCGAEYEHVRDDFLQCLSRTDHRAACKVWSCIATWR